MRISLVFPQLVHEMRDGDNTLPPNAIFYLAAILRNLGYEVRTHVLPRVDLCEHSFVDQLVSDCDVLGLSANSINWRTLRQFAIMARSLHKDLPIVLGGVHATMFDRHALDVTPANYVIRGEAERSFPELLDALRGGRDLSSIGSLTYRDRSGDIHVNPSRPLLNPMELAAQPVPAFDLLPAGEYHGIAIESSRGCAFNCVFCSIPFRRSFRALDAETFALRLTKSIDQAHHKLISPFQKSSVYILDDCFTTNKKRVVQIFHLLRHLKNRVRYGVEARADQITSAVADAMAEHECWLIQMGLESGYAEGLRKVNKGLRIDQIERSCAILSDYGLSSATDYAFIIGFPWETKGDCLSTLAFATYLHLKYGGHISLSWYEPFPGSPMWDARTALELPMTLEIYDNLTYNWRSDSDLFRRIRPLLSWHDIEDIEESIDCLTHLDPKYLSNFRYFCHAKTSQTAITHRVSANNSL